MDPNQVLLFTPSSYLHHPIIYTVLLFTPSSYLHGPLLINMSE